MNLTEGEIRWLCVRSREIFIQQPVLLELEAPIKICGMIEILYNVINIYIYTIKVIFMANITIY